MFSAMVLAAGLGTRLLPLTQQFPKPLLPVGDRPLLLQLLSTLRAGGATRLALNVHHLGDQIEREIEQLGFEVQVSNEPVLRGTAGGIWGARKWLQGSPQVLIVNGDFFGTLPVGELLAAPPSPLVLAVVPRPLGEGSVGIGGEGEVVRLRGECFGTELRSGDYIGVARLAPGVLDGLPELGCLVGDWALPQLRAGARLGSVTTTAPFFDIGSRGGFLDANLAWLEQRGLDQFLGPEARVSEGVNLHQAVIGRGARVLGYGEVRRCVFLPGAVAQAPLENCVVLPSGEPVRVAG